MLHMPMKPVVKKKKRKGADLCANLRLTPTLHPICLFEDQNARFEMLLKARLLEGADSTKPAVAQRLREDLSVH